jgi:hypothetical protein
MTLIGELAPALAPEAATYSVMGGIFWLQMDWHSKVEDVALIGIIVGVFAIRACGWQFCAVYNRTGESALYADKGLLESSRPHSCVDSESATIRPDKDSAHAACALLNYLVS